MIPFLWKLINSQFKKIAVRIRSTGRILTTIPSTDGEVEYQARVGTGIFYLSNVKLEGMNVIDHNILFSGDVQLGYATTVGEGCRFTGDISIGKYCQVGPQVCFQAEDHDYEMLTMYNNPILMGGELRHFRKKKAISIGHGVWIGQGAILLKGVKVGNGAVIGAGAIVTKDVPAYHIAIGNPARVIKQRFDDQICSLIEQSAWWECSVGELGAFKALLTQNLSNNRLVAIKLLNDFIAVRNRK